MWAPHREFFLKKDQFTWQWASAPAPPSGGSALGGVLGGEQDTVFSPPHTPSCGFPLGSGLTFSTSWGLDVFLLEKKSQTGGSLGNLPALGDQQSRKRDGFSPGRRVQLEHPLPQVSWGGLSTQVGRVSPSSACLG